MEQIEKERKTAEREDTRARATSDAELEREKIRADAAAATAKAQADAQSEWQRAQAEAMRAQAQATREAGLAQAEAMRENNWAWSSTSTDNSSPGVWGTPSFDDEVVVEGEFTEFDETQKIEPNKLGQDLETNETIDFKSQATEVVEKLQYQMSIAAESKSFDLGWVLQFIQSYQQVDIDKFTAELLEQFWEGETKLMSWKEMLNKYLDSKWIKDNTRNKLFDLVSKTDDLEEIAKKLQNPQWFEKMDRRLLKWL